MRLAFDGIARVLFDAGLLSEPVLTKYLPLFVWESAIAAGWWRFASETRTSLFREQVGRYWVWRDGSRNWDMLFAPETAAWRARLLEVPAPDSDPTGPRNGQKRARPAKSGVVTVPFAPPGTCWEDVRITFLSDERVEIQIGSQRETRNYEEMGFGDRRNGTPTKSWILLRGLASKQGIIPVEGRKQKGWAAIEKHIERTRKLLRKLFGITDDPLPFEKGTGYCLRCRIGRARSYDT
jgi:hypothetical protein